MSRIGLQPITVPQGVKVNVDGSRVTVSGGKGELLREVPSCLKVELDGDTLSVARTEESKAARAMHGTVRSLIANMVEGVDKGFTRALEIQGVGFRAQLKGNTIVLQVGYSHAIEYEPPAGVVMTAPSDTEVVVTGPDKQAVGQAAAQIRGYCPAEPYKGKGIRYKGENVRRKAGKTVG